MDETFKEFDELERLFLDDEEDKQSETSRYSSSNRGYDGPPQLSQPKKTELTSSFREKPKSTVFADNKITNFFEKSSIYTDPVFGLRIIKPLISSAVLTERMQGRLAVGFARIKFHVEQGDKEKDWVLAGAIVSKMVKVSQKGTKYTLWKLSDLKNDIKTISVMLFKAAHNDLCKTAEGMIVAILNPGIMDSKEGSRDECTLSVAETTKVMILGQSKDLGRCKSKTKAGEPCPAIVNVTDCEYCIFHVKQEYKRSSGRSELQSATSGRGLNELRNKILGKNEVFYAGQSYSAIPAKKNAKRTAKDNQRLESLSNAYRHPSNSNEVKPKPAERLEINNKQRQKDIARLAQLKGENIPPAPLSVSSPSTTVNFSSKLTAKASPSLSKSGFTFDFNVTSKQQARAKAKAAQVLQQKPIEKVDPNSTRGTTNGKKRAIDDLNRSLEEPEVKKAKHEDEAAKQKRILDILNTKSSHTDLIDQKEREAQDKYFTNLEKKEAMEEKMLATTKVSCKAIICLKCKYVALSAAERCKEEKHPLKVKDAEKRFFKCKDCGNRTISLQRLPKLACKNCHSSRWERTGMVDEKKVLVGEKLSIRGDEEAWIGQCGSVNLNLLVPDSTDD